MIKYEKYSEKNVNLSKICTKYLDRQNLKPLPAGQSSNDNFFLVRSQSLCIFRNCQKFKDQ